MKLETTYPKLFATLEDKELELRHLLNVDENYEDYDSEEFDFDPEEYNYVIYIAEPIFSALGEEKMEELMVKLNEKEAFKNFLPTELDLYGVQTDLNEEEIVAMILDLVEEIL
jgi:hypothetical protein